MEEKGTTETVVVPGFKTGDEPEFQKPDRDPLGELPADAAHTQASCRDCDASGLVPVATFDAYPLDVTVELVCEDCADDE